MRVAKQHRFPPRERVAAPLGAPPSAVLLAVWLGMAAGCAQGDAAAVGDAAATASPAVAPPAASSESAMAPGARREAAAAPALPREPGALGTVTSEPVHGFQGPDGTSFEVARRPRDGRPPHARQFGRTTLELGMRPGNADLGSYPCSSCHVGTGLVTRDPAGEGAHQNVSTVHPDRVGGGCSSCHAPEDVSLLVLHTAERVTLDHAYRLCTQCHFAQTRDWAAGAHGKRLDGWTGRRVVLGCADCHDPHRPQLVQRAPFPGPRLPTRGKGAER